MTADGMRSFVVGTGGAELTNMSGRLSSQQRNARVEGVRCLEADAAAGFLQLAIHLDRTVDVYGCRIGFLPLVGFTGFKQGFTGFIGSKVRPS